MVRVRLQAFRAVDHEPQARQRARLMGRPSLLGHAFSGCAAPPPSLAITDALQATSLVMRRPV
jgi:hypothetical protein